MIDGHLNHEYYTDGAGDNVPICSRDRYSSQDIGRDFWYLLDRAGINVMQLMQDAPVLISGGIVTQGAGDTLNIPITKGFVNFTVEAPLSFAATPPTTANLTSVVYVESTVQTNMAIASATLDGATPNYVKLKFKDADSGLTRTRAYGVGNYEYKKEPSFEIVVDAVANTGTDILLATFIGVPAGGFTFSDSSDIAESHVVRDQAHFNSLFFRTAANTYDIRSGIRRIDLEYLSGDYNAKDSTPGFLQGGDTYAAIKTNDCSYFKAASSVAIDTGNTEGYIEVDTNDCLLRNISIKGTGTVASNISRSFLLNAYRVVFDSCKCFTRLSNSGTTFMGFKGSATAAHNVTSKYSNCHVYDYHGSAGSIYGFRDCNNVNNSSVLDLDNSSGSIYGFKDCYNVNNSSVLDLDNSGGDTYGVYDCNRLSNISVEELDASVNAFGFCSCDQISACYANDIDGNNGNAYGFYNCSQISACNANDIDSVAGTANGFAQCFYGAALFTTELLNAGNNFIDCDAAGAAIPNKDSTPNVWT